MTTRELQVRRALAHRPVFERGEVVRYVNESVATMLDTHEKSVGPCEYVVIATEGHWLQVACLKHRGDGPGQHRKFPRDYPGVGSSYFRIVGPCGLHAPTWRPDDERERLDDADRLGFSVCLGWKCARCDAPLPEALSTYHLYRKDP